MMKPKHILVAVNSLSGRDAAFERALALARSSGAALYLLHAVPASHPFSARGVERLERMATLRQRAEEAGVRVLTGEQHGDAAEIIELHANARGVDLIVMGAEVRRGWGRRRSPVAESVIRRTDIPTLVVASDAPESPAPFHNVLVAVDLSPASEDLLRTAVELTAEAATQLTVMHTVRSVEAADAVQSPARWAVPEYRTHLVEDARESLEAVAAAVPAGVDTRLRVATGSPARAILEHASDLDADLVVVGRSRGFKMLGTTALRVLRRNDRALLVIPNTSPHNAVVERQHAA
jgi:nucleotide-binding universal stress UspA family protein